MKKRIPQSHISFVNKSSGIIHDNIWKELDCNYWQFADLIKHEKNTINSTFKRSSENSIFPDFILLDPGQFWNNESQKVEENIESPKAFKVDLDCFLAGAEVFFSKFSKLHIGVQVSGGVDSSLIIGLLRYFDIQYSLIGAFADRYEFRMERFIQNKLVKNSKKNSLIDVENYLPMTFTNEIPAHQYPNSSSCNYEINNIMAIECKRLSVDVLLSGSGGDVLLGKEVLGEACSWIPAIFNDSWLQDIVYAPQGVQLLSFYSDSTILECLWNLRRGQKPDPRKLWARNFFRDFLPKELVEYTYKADFWGLYIDGLINSLPKIREIHGKAYDLSKNPYFLEDNLNQILKDDLYSCDQKLYQRLEARMSSAVWINSLLSN